MTARLRQAQAHEDAPDGAALVSAYVAHIGINVGKGNALPMSMLSGLVAPAGCAHVRTYIQSEHAREPKTLHLGFLEAAPSAAKVALLDPQRSETDQFAVRGEHLYLFTPHGLGKSKLTTSFFARLGTANTMRNWNTVLELQSMLQT